MRIRIHGGRTIKNAHSGSVLVSLMIGVCLSVLVGGGIYMWKEGTFNEYKDAQILKIKGLETQLNAIDTERDELAKERDTVRLRLKEVEEKKNSVEWEILQVKEKHADLLEQIRPLKKQITSLSVENEALKKEILRFKDAVAAYTEEQKKMKALIAAQNNSTEKTDPGAAKGAKEISSAAEETPEEVVPEVEMTTTEETSQKVSEENDPAS